MTKIARFKKGKHKGFSCKRIVYREPIKYVITTPEGKEIIVDNIEEFCKNTDFQAKGFRRVASGQTKSYKKYLCRYLEN
jgi:hypothetical protein